MVRGNLTLRHTFRLTPRRWHRQRWLRRDGPLGHLIRPRIDGSWRCSFATLFTDDGISIWRWGHDEAPAGTRSGEPNPSNWGSPLAHWSATSCDISKYFGAQTLTFNIELCGE